MVIHKEKDTCVDLEIGLDVKRKMNINRMYNLRSTNSMYKYVACNAKYNLILHYSTQLAPRLGFSQ